MLNGMLLIEEQEEEENTQIFYNEINYHKKR